MDYFTKLPEAIALMDQTAETVVEVLVDEVFARFGLCMQLHSDQGRNFESAVFSEVLRSLRFDKTRTSPLHPQSNCMVERFNRTLLDCLSKFVEHHQRDWDEYLPILLLSYRSAVHQSTQQTPALLTFGKELRLPTQLLTGDAPNTPTLDISEYVAQLREHLDVVYHFN